MTQPVFVLIHGAWHRGAHWEPVVDRLTDAGYQVSVPDLPGCGSFSEVPESYLSEDSAEFESEPSPLATLSLDDWTDAVEETVREAARARSDGSSARRVVLVAHSLGGLPVTRAVERVGELLHRVVYLSAHCLVRLPDALSYFALAENGSSLASAIQIGDPAQTGAVRINPRHSDAEYQATLKRCFYADLAEDAATKAVADLSPDLPVRVVVDDPRPSLEGWGPVPRSYVRCTQDQANPIALQDLMIAEADAATPGNAFDVVTLESGHSPFLSQPDRLAEVLIAVAR
jgi:pimeloyl-ACP methyl ester carboxylesterase